MEEEVLLDMYRKSWDDFLEAYKDKLDEIEFLKTSIKRAIEKEDLDGLRDLISEEK